MLHWRSAYAVGTLVLTVVFLSGCGDEKEATWECHGDGVALCLGPSKLCGPIRRQCLQRIRELGQPTYDQQSKFEKFSEKEQDRRRGLVMAAGEGSGRVNLKFSEASIAMLLKGGSFRTSVVCSLLLIATSVAALSLFLDQKKLMLLPRVRVTKEDIAGMMSSALAAARGFGIRAGGALGLASASGQQKVKATGTVSSEVLAGMMSSAIAAAKGFGIRAGGVLGRASASGQQKVKATGSVSSEDADDTLMASNVTSNYAKQVGETMSVHPLLTKQRQLEGWESAVDPNSGDTYSYNYNTMESTWDFVDFHNTSSMLNESSNASQFGEPISTHPLLTKRRQSEGWEIAVDPISGDTYYYNYNTMEATWDFDNVHKR